MHVYTTSLVKFWSLILQPITSFKTTFKKTLKIFYVVNDLSSKQFKNN